MPLVNRLVALAAMLLAFAPAAMAADQHNLTLDATTSSIAGHPTQVYCEDSWQEWLSFGHPEADGFTTQGQPWIWISPRQCETLSALGRGQDVGTYYASSALLALAHEAEHQKGLVDEGQTDCAALPLVPKLATQFFAVSPTVPVKVYRMVKGKLVVKTKRVVNPWLTKLAQDALRWHRQKPPEYQGGC